MNDNQRSQIPPGMLMRIIQGKQDTIAYYERLHTMTPDRQAVGIIRDILQDEKGQLDLFVNLYMDLFGDLPDLSGGAPLQIHSFIDGVNHSILQELHTYDFYGNIFFTDQNKEVRNIFLRALFDENSHSTKFTYIYIKALESKFLERLSNP